MLLRKFDEIYADFSADMSALKDYVIDLRKLIGAAETTTAALDLKDLRGTTLGDLGSLQPLLKKMVESAETRVASARAMNGKSESVKESILQVQGKGAEIQARWTVYKDPAIVSAIENRELGPEQEELKRKLNSKSQALDMNIDGVEDVMHDARERFRNIDRRLLLAPDFDVICRTIRRISESTLATSDTLDGITKGLDAMNIAVPSKHHVGSPPRDRTTGSQLRSKRSGVFGLTDGFATGPEDEDARDDAAKDQPSAQILARMNERQKIRMRLQGRKGGLESVVKSGVGKSDGVVGTKGVVELRPALKGTVVQQPSPAPSSNLTPQKSEEKSAFGGFGGFGVGSTSPSPAFGATGGMLGGISSGSGSKSTTPSFGVVSSISFNAAAPKDREPISIPAFGKPASLGQSASASAPAPAPRPAFGVFATSIIAKSPLSQRVNINPGDVQSEEDDGEGEEYDEDEEEEEQEGEEEDGELEDESAYLESETAEDEEDGEADEEDAEYDRVPEFPRKTDEKKSDLWAPKPISFDLGKKPAPATAASLGLSSFSTAGSGAASFGSKDSAGSGITFPTFKFAGDTTDEKGSEIFKPSISFNSTASGPFGSFGKTAIATADSKTERPKPNISFTPTGSSPFGVSSSTSSTNEAVKNESKSEPFKPSGSALFGAAATRDPGQAEVKAETPKLAFSFNTTGSSLFGASAGATTAESGKTESKSETPKLAFSFNTTGSLLFGAASSTAESGKTESKAETPRPAISFNTASALFGAASATESGKSDSKAETAKPAISFNTGSSLFGASTGSNSPKFGGGTLFGGVESKTSTPPTTSATTPMGMAVAASTSGAPKASSSPFGGSAASAGDGMKFSFLANPGTPSAPGSPAKSPKGEASPLSSANTSPKAKPCTEEKSPEAKPSLAAFSLGGGFGGSPIPAFGSLVSAANYANTSQEAGNGHGSPFAGFAAARSILPTMSPPKPESEKKAEDVKTDSEKISSLTSSKKLTQKSSPLVAAKTTSFSFAPTLNTAEHPESVKPDNRPPSQVFGATLGTGTFGSSLKSSSMSPKAPGSSGTAEQGTEELKTKHAETRGTEGLKEASASQSDKVEDCANNQYEVRSELPLTSEPHAEPIEGNEKQEVDSSALEHKQQFESGESDQASTGTISEPHVVYTKPNPGPVAAQQAINQQESAQDGAFFGASAPSSMPSYASVLRSQGAPAQPQPPAAVPGLAEDDMDDDGIAGNDRADGLDLMFSGDASFGLGGQATVGLKMPVFGQTTTGQQQTGSVSNFGQRATSQPFQTSTFQSSWGSIGGSNNSDSALAPARFGGLVNSTGNAPTGGSTASSGFGSSSVFGSSTNAGGLSAPGFGTTTGFGGNVPAFGSTTGMGSAPTFGSTTGFGAGAPAFGSGGGGPTFGAATGIGSGGAPAFGSTTGLGGAKPAFSSTSGFGGGPTFGGGFGSSFGGGGFGGGGGGLGGNVSFPSMSSSGGGFSSFSATEDVSFASLAGQGSTFGEGSTFDGGFGGMQNQQQQQSGRLDLSSYIFNALF
ncbi:hypothetical protein BJ742DRAFT_131314 [Cladochytrium replicatum]|nr:hypothetical protein BJ742DRAFT_131314 [Cladochytrium replicatum]